MKKIILGIFISLLVISNGYADNVRLGQEISCTQDLKNQGCNQCFESRTLRYGNTYELFDNVRNDTKGTIFIDYTDIQFSRGSNIYNDTKNLKLFYSDWIKGKKYILNPGDAGTLVRTSDFSIDNVPSEGRKKNNVFVEYISGYQKVINGTPTGNTIEHKECQPYSISWCGDGVLDPEFDETCDPKDPSKKGWGAGGCDEKTCKPVQKPVECKGLTAKPNTGEAPFNTSFSCEGLNASSYKIDIKNSSDQIINTINGKTGEYNFKVPGTYIATCYADTKTSQTCNQVITVKEKPKPQATCENLETKVSVEKGQTSTFTCNGKNTENYKIKIVDGTGKVIKEIFGKTGTFTFDKNGSYVASCYVDNKTTTETSCVKPISVTDPIVPKIKVDKTDKNPADKDGKQENDTQTVGLKDKAVFKITVTNNGTEDLDEISLKDDVIESDTDAPMCDKSVSQVNEILQSKFNRTYLKPGESFDYTCERASEAKDPDTYTNKIVVDGKGKISLKKVKDEDPTKVNKSVEPKIKVDKTDKNPADKDGKQENDTQTIKESDKAVFKITVTNNGTEDLKNVSLVDDVLNLKVDAPSCDKSIDEVNNILKTIGNKDNIFNIGETFDYTCERANHKDDTNPYTNEIKVTGIGVKSGKNVEDKDPTEVKKETNGGGSSPASCTNLTVNKNEQTFECKGTGKGFKVIFKDSSGKELHKLEDLSATSIFKGKYSDLKLQNLDRIECLNAYETTPKSQCNVTLSSGGGGSSPASCTNLTVDKDKKEFECKGTGKGFKLFFKDSNGKIIKEVNEPNIYNSLKGTYTGLSNLKTVECLNAYETTPKSQCTYTVSTPGGGGGGGGSSGGGGGGSGGDYCGDGILQRPSTKNPDGKGGFKTIMEECDFGSQNGKTDSNGKMKCNSSCQLPSIETFPGEQFFEFLPKETRVIGLNMSPYDFRLFDNKKIKIVNKNRKEGSIHIEQICVTNISKFNRGESFEKHTYCSDPVDERGGIVHNFNPGTTLYMRDTRGLSRFIANKINGKFFDDNVFVLTIVTGSEEERKIGGARNNPVYQNTKFLSSADRFVVRVAKSSIKTTGGGTAYVSGDNRGKISDISKIVEDRKIINVDGTRENVKVTDKDNKNFVGTSITEFLTSYSKNIEKSGKIESEKESFNNSSSNLGDKAGTTRVEGKDSFKEYNGITGAYILKGQSFTLNSSNIESLLNKYQGPKTFIIEGGDLYINTNITHDQNIAFVVKGGHIIIGKDVKNLYGTYISIPKSNKGGRITGEQSSEQLVVTGSLYGNLSELIKNRTYMKVNDSGQLDVGTVVSYGSSVFRKPAPLISTFVDEYVKATKIAQ